VLGLSVEALIPPLPREARRHPDRAVG